MAARRWWTGVLISMALVAVLGAANDPQPPPGNDPRAVPAVGDNPPKPGVTPVAGPDTAKESRRPPLSLDNLKSPGGAILILYEEAKDALRLLPKAVVLTPEKFQDMLDQIEQLRRQLKPERPLVPSVCKVSGRADGPVARLNLQFEFKTERPRTAVALGCRRGWALSATLGDGQLAVFQPVAEEGYVLLVDKPGTYQVTLEVAAPLLTRGNERLVDIDLPRAPITILENLDLPATATEARVGTRMFRTKATGSPPTARLETIPLGPADRLEVAWKGTAAAAQVARTLTARGRIVTRVEETLILTEAELTLQVLSGATGEWRIQIPPTLALEKILVLPPVGAGPPEKQTVQDERVKSISPPTKAEPFLTIALKEPSAEPLRVVLHVSQRREATVPVVPFAVFDVQPQHGTIEVRGRPDLRLRPHLRGEVVQREVTDEMRALGTVAAFTYWNLPPAGVKPATLVQAPLTLELDRLKGTVEARVTQTLQLVAATAEAAPIWRVTTKVDLTPGRISVDRLDIELPAGYQFTEQAGVTPSTLVENPVEVKEGMGGRRTMMIRLAQRQSQPWSFDFIGLIPLTPGRQEATLELPRLGPLYGGGITEPLHMLDRGGRVEVTLSPTLELLPRVLPVEATLAEGTAAASWSVERMPVRVELAWQARRTEARVRITADVVIHGQQARVKQRLQFTRLPRELRLRIPAGVTGPVRLADGTELRPEDGVPPNGNGWTADLGPPREGHLTLSYTVALPEPEAPARELAEMLGVPLLQTEGGGEARVFVWTDPDVRPELVPGSWEELALEPGSDPDRLPDLVLRGNVADKLFVRLSRRAAAPHLAATVERVLVRVTLTDGGTQLYRVRFLLSKVHARHLDLELPVPLGRVGLSVRLDGKEVRRWLVDDTGRAVEVSRTVRLEIEPELARKPVILDITYPLSGGRGEGSTGWQSHLRPPVLTGAVLLGRVRWNVDLAPAWLAVHTGGASSEHRWAWWGWLPAPRPAASSDDLENWFATADTTLGTEEAEPGLVCWQSTLGPVRVIHVPQQAWLLACSLTFLAIGLGLSFLPLPRTLFWTVVAVLGALVAVVSVLWPSTLPLLIYGCEPAALVLLLVVCVQWTLHQRYRRRLIFLPGFTRMKGGSSLIRSSSSSSAGPAAAREPSTVDQVPPRQGSSMVGSQGS